MSHESKVFDGRKHTYDRVKMSKDKKKRKKGCRKHLRSTWDRDRWICWNMGQLIVHEDL